MKKIAVLFCTCIILIGCTSTPKVDIVAEAEAIRNLEEQWNIALQTSDANKIISFFSTEIVSMQSNKPIAVGIQAARNITESMFADTTLLFKTYTTTIDAIEVSAAGELAYVRGQDQITVKTKDGLVQEESKWVDIWKKSDGQWKVVLNIGNSNKPLKGQ